MSENTAGHSPRYQFTTSAPELQGDTLNVVRFHGEEGLNSLFSFTVELVSSNPALDTGALLQAPACLSINRENGAPAIFTGYPARVEQGGEFHGWTYYTVELRPSLWKCTQIRQSAIFLNKNLQATLQELLSSQQFFSFAHTFKLMDSEYPVPEFAMQHNESVYDYMCWRLEEQGAYFFIEPDSGAVVFADHPRSHTALGNTPELTYSPVTNLEGSHVPEVITTFRLIQTPLPRRVVIRSYDWKSPENIVLGTADVKSNGLGDVYLPHETVTTSAEANRLARLRAEELICRSRQFHGESAAPDMRPGYTFTLKQHPTAPFNREYLLTSVSHEGSQETFLSMALGIPMHGVQEHLFYRNAFTCIESDTPYRPARTAPRAKVDGIIRAFIDAAGSGARAEMDGYGRYKVLFPFDISGRNQGKASCWIRMAQPHLGKDSGMSFPLRGGTEVTVAFEEGNPDLPVITGALANGEVTAQTRQGTENFTGMRTAGGNQLAFNDTDTHQGLSLSTASGAGLRVSSGSADWMSTSAGTMAQITGCCNTVATTLKNSVTGLRSTTMVGSSFSSGLLIAKFADALVTSLGQSFSSSTNKDWQTAGKWTKLGAMIMDIVVQGMANAGALTGDKAMPFGAVLSADAGGAKSMLRVLPSMGELITLQVLSMIARTGGVAASHKATAVQNEESRELQEKYTQALNAVREELCSVDKEYVQHFAPGTSAYGSADCAAMPVLSNAVEDAIIFLRAQSDVDGKSAAHISKLQSTQSTMNNLWGRCCTKTVHDDGEAVYEDSYKQPVTLDYAVSSLTTLLPEIVGGCILIYNSVKLNKKKNKFGGIFLNAPDANINISAANTVSTHAEQGVLTCTVPDPEVYISDGYGNVPKGRMQWGTGKDGELTPPGCVTKTPFIHIKSAEVTKDYGSEISATGDEIFDRVAGAENGNAFNYIADRTGFRYTAADRIVERASTEHISEAIRHVLFTPQNTLTLREARPNGRSFDGTNEGEPGISLIAHLAVKGADTVSAAAVSYQTACAAWRSAVEAEKNAKKALKPELLHKTLHTAYANAQTFTQSQYAAMNTARDALVTAVRTAYDPDKHHISLLVQEPGVAPAAPVTYTSLVLKKAGAQLAYGKDANTDALKQNRVLLDMKQGQGALTAGDDAQGKNGASLLLKQGDRAALQYGGAEISSITLADKKITLDPGKGGTIHLCNMQMQKNKLKVKEGDLRVLAQGKIKLG